MRIGYYEYDDDYKKNIFVPAIRKARIKHGSMFAICRKCGKFKNRGDDRCLCKGVWRYKNGRKR